MDYRHHNSLTHRSCYRSIGDHHLVLSSSQNYYVLYACIPWLRVGAILKTVILLTAENLHFNTTSHWQRWLYIYTDRLINITNSGYRHPADHYYVWHCARQNYFSVIMHATWSPLVAVPVLQPCSGNVVLFSNQNISCRTERQKFTKLWR